MITNTNQLCIICRASEMLLQCLQAAQISKVWITSRHKLGYSSPLAMCLPCSSKTMQMQHHADSIDILEYPVHQAIGSWTHLPGHRATRADANTHGCYMNCIRMKVIRSSLRSIQILKNPKITQTMRLTKSTKILTHIAQTPSPQVCSHCTKPVVTHIRRVSWYSATQTNYASSAEQTASAPSWNIEGVFHHDH